MEEQVKKPSPLKVLIWPDHRLMDKASEVADFNEKIQLPGRDSVTLSEFAELLKLTMLTYRGIGLAANQVGVLKRVMVVRDLAKAEDIVLVNPHILSYGNPQPYKDEGCLSFPGVDFNTMRFTEFALRYQDVTGVERDIRAEGMLAVELQHEYDHLDGVTLMQFVKGHASRDRIRSHLDKFKRHQEKLAKRMEAEAKFQSQK